MKKYRIVAIISVICIFLSGCYGKEPNSIAYVVALGIDSGENGNYNITIQYANPNKISGGEEGSQSDESGVENIDFDAADIYEAIGLADRVGSKTFSLAHTNLIVFSEEEARKGISNMAELFTRDDELRPDVYLAVSEKSASEYLKNVNPATEINPTKYYHFLFDKNKIMGLPEGTQNNFYCGIESGDYDMILPIARTESEEEAGSAVFKGGTMVGTLNEEETEIYKLLDEDNASGYLTVNTGDKKVTVKLVQDKKPKYIIDDENKKITAKLFLDGDMTSVPFAEKKERDEFEKSCENYITEAVEKLIKTVLVKYGSDIFRLKEKSKLKFLTNSEYEDYKKNTDYSEYDIEAQVEFKLEPMDMAVKEK